MSLYYERSVIDEYPGAGVIIPGDLDEEDCTHHPSLHALVKKIASGAGGTEATTIIGGLAFTEAPTATLAAVCLLPKGLPGDSNDVIGRGALQGDDDIFGAGKETTPVDGEILEG